ncbi:hypothetical protein G3I40_26060 [Streptomyces sp. SID14478]|uniref:hypothetical protein n=1 Tax=Streptomyces sp. SID14478 TaxID=2706073 RepID=UPI0013DAC998|nr:hypothetical protein [Streptomyces sp. SID14478]NEB78667.1 hypothetical protein [Streptomyces sp. SID14478]
MEDRTDPSYWDEVAAALHARGLPPEHVTAVLADLTALAGDLGPAAELAERLVPAGAPVDEHTESRRWTADTYADEALLNRFGADGWEVERVDADGCFVARRDPEGPQRWEYRRESAGTGGPAPEGWEPCGTWAVYAWYKRRAPAAPAPTQDRTRRQARQRWRGTRPRT